ncbi:MAG: hypothetical protein J5929_09605 [Eubacterium sp.]|nr:hypothetical protein [Eubacterium sp.]
MKCPKCGREFERLLALSRDDNKTMICDDCGTAEALRDFGVYVHKNKPNRRLNHQERTRAQVYATGNKWAIENFEATHS